MDEDGSGWIDAAHLTPDLDEVRELEERLQCRPWREDRAFVARHLAGDFAEIGRSGKRWDRAAILDQPPQPWPPSVVLHDLRMLRLGDDLVLLRYTGSHGSDGRVHRSSLWRRGTPGWQVVYHQATPEDAPAPPAAPGDRPAPVLVGERVRLRPTAAADKPALLAIRSTPEVRARWRGDDLEAELDDDLTDPDLVPLTIERLGDGEIVGYIQYAEEADPEYRHAGMDLYIDPAHWRRGYALDAIRTLVAHLVGERGHHRLVIDPAADNTGAIECYRRAGFAPVGVMRRYERQADGTWADGLLMELVVDP